MPQNEILISRSIVINAAPATVHAQINNFHNWLNWSPWEGIDPNLQRTYSGPDAGVGTYYAWTGTRKVGSGNMKITESTPTTIVLDLNFLKPFKANNITTFFVQPTATEKGDGTTVTWQMEGKKNLFFKIFGFAISMDKMLSKDFEGGLSQLKSVAEAN